jgi:hypothetical protein
MMELCLHFSITLHGIVFIKHRDHLVTLPVEEYIFMTEVSAVALAILSGGCGLALISYSTDAIRVRPFDKGGCVQNAA